VRQPLASEGEPDSEGSRSNSNSGKQGPDTDSTIEGNLEQRAINIQNALDPFAQSKRTTATAKVSNPDGTEQTLVASSVNRLSPAQRALLLPKEIEVIGKGHAEATIIDQALANGQTVIDIAASRPICSNCAAKANSVGANIESAIKK